jgi:Tat protein secretion system quality control protein TatD with DNase activity
MRQLLQHGWYLSFGTLFNEESARTCPPERLLAETDDKDVPVGLVYERIAQVRGTTVDALAAQMRENYGKLFGNAVIQAL